MKVARSNWQTLSGAVAMVLALSASPVFAGNEAEVAEHLIDLVKIGRGVLSEQMNNINDPSKADKGFTGNYMATQVMERFKKKNKIDLRVPNVVPQAGLYLALVEAEKEVVDEAQPIINRPGIGFKGFIPAVFARKTGEHFYKKSGVKLKLTGLDYRNNSNRPDDFEAEVLRMFSDPRHPKGQTYVRNTMLDGRPVLRMMDPEYAGPSCLGCHGAPKGGKDITGGHKEGWKEGDLAGAISVVLPLK
ncbi:Tll0287-like domain-containing protein [Petrachloros mirabilis]